MTMPSYEEMFADAHERAKQIADESEHWGDREFIATTTQQIVQHEMMLALLGALGYVGFKLAGNTNEMRQRR